MERMNPNLTTQDRHDYLMRVLHEECDSLPDFVETVIDDTLLFTPLTLIKHRTWIF